MNRGLKLFSVGAFFAVIAALSLAIALQPKQPDLAGDSGYQEQPAHYRAGGASCEPAKIRALPIGLRESKADSCADAEEQHREAANNLIENRRAAKATEAGAISTTNQARIEAWGAAIGLLTLFAAISAAIFAERAAEHTKRSANLQSESNERQLRPYVSFTETGEKNVGPFTRESSFELRVKNFGKTPANDVKLFYQFDFRDKPIGWTPIELPAEPLSFGKLSPGDYRGATVWLEDLTTEQVDRIKSGQSAAMVRYKVTYELPNGETDGDDITLWIDQKGWASGMTRQVTREDRERK